LLSTILAVQQKSSRFNMTTRFTPSSIEVSNLARVLSPQGRFDAHEAPTFRDDVAAVIADGSKSLIINLQDVVFIDSTALAELVSAQRAMVAADGTFSLLNPTVAVRVILEVTGLISVFTIAP
jgi:anti-sigma B factor antagonist